MLEIERLIWDEWNTAHIARHDVIPEEVEEACDADPAILQTYGDRLLIVGLTRRRRILGVVLDPVGSGIYYVVTARPASRKERRLYQEMKGDDET